MAGSKLTALPDLALPAVTDEMYIVRPSLGSAGSLSVTVANLKDFLFSGVPIAFPAITTSIANSGGTLTNLHSFTLPAGSLASNGDYLWVRQGGTFASNDNDKRIQLTFDGQVIGNTGLVDFDAGSWTRDLLINRLTATTVRVTALDALGFINFLNGAAGGSGVLGAINIDLTVSNLNSNSVVLLVQGQGTASNDVTQNLSAFELTQF